MENQFKEEQCQRKPTRKTVKATVMEQSAIVEVEETRVEKATNNYINN